MGVSFKNNSLNASIILRNPEFSDSKSLGINLQVMTAMDGSVVTYRTPARTSFSLEFRDLSRIKAEELRDWFNTTSGTLIDYIDQAGTLWTGYITTPVLDLQNEGKGRLDVAGVARAESFRTTFEFEVADPASVV